MVHDAHGLSGLSLIPEVCNETKFSHICRKAVSLPSVNYTLAHFKIIYLINTIFRGERTIDM